MLNIKSGGIGVQRESGGGSGAWRIPLACSHPLLPPLTFLAASERHRRSGSAGEWTDEKLARASREANLPENGAYPLIRLFVRRPSSCLGTYLSVYHTRNRLFSLVFSG